MSNHVFVTLMRTVEVDLDSTPIQKGDSTDTLLLRISDDHGSASTEVLASDVKDKDVASLVQYAADIDDTARDMVNHALEHDVSFTVCGNVYAAGDLKPAAPKA